MAEKQEKVPRENLPEVKKIIADTELHNFEKAVRIQKIDYIMACQGGDSYVTTMTVNRIEQLLNAREEK